MMNRGHGTCIMRYMPIKKETLLFITIIIPNVLSMKTTNP